MSQIFVFIATKSTVDPVLPVSATSQVDFNRRVALGFSALAGDYTRVGDLKLRPTADSIALHLLCDGSEVSKTEFQELSAYLGDSQGTPTVSTNFVLPDYRGTSLEAAPIVDTPAQSVDNSTVSTGGEIVTPSDSGQIGGTTGGNVPSGGRPGLNEYEQEQ